MKWILNAHPRSQKATPLSARIGNRFGVRFSTRIALQSILAGMVIVTFAVPAFSELTEKDRPKFAKKKMRLGSHTINVEVADDDSKREFGLMFRKSLPENEGMLFIFDNSQKLNFWMKNTLIPLSIGYFDENMKLLEIHEMLPQIMGEREPRTYPSHAPAKYALEMPAHWFRQNSIKSGVVFTFVGKP